MTQPFRPVAGLRRPAGRLRRLFGGLRARVILTYLVIFVVSALILVTRTGSVFGTMALENARHDLRARTYVIASALERPLLGDGGDRHGVNLGALAARMGDEDGAARLTLFDAAGRWLASSASGAPTGPGHSKEIDAALTGRLESDMRVDPTTGQQMIYAAAPIGEEGHMWGVVQVAMPAAQAIASVRSFWLGLGLTALLAAAVAALAGWILAGQLVRPVDRLRDAALTLAAGDLDERVPPEDTGGVTEIVQLAEAFNDMAGRIQDTLNRQRQFVADASHELRTPLTNIKLRAEALGAGALDDPNVAQRFVGEIESEANRLSRMASDLLALSRQDAGAPIFREYVDVGSLAAQVASDMTLRAEKAGITLATHIAPGLPLIMADPVGLHTVLVNLVDNALQYTPAAGRVTVCAGLGSPPALVLTVTDTGSGIPADDLPHVFDRFYRIDKARSRRMAQRSGQQTPQHTGGGAGLGLAIVRGIVEEHGGTVRAESTVGQGTTMTVVLPLNVER